MKTVCIVASAGRGRRLKQKKDKPFIEIAGKPILAHTLAALESSKIIDSIVVVVPRDKVKICKKLVKKHRFKKVSGITPGGKERFDSVKCGLGKAPEADLVMVHDGARPFIEEALVKKVLRAAKTYGAAICATPLKQTLKLAGKNLFITKTLKRASLWEAQTPQAFRRNLIEEAYGGVKERSSTDDSSLLERLGHKVKIVMGSHRNIKITTPEDLELAKILIGNR